MSARFHVKKAQFESKFQIAPNEIIFHRDLSDAAKIFILSMHGIASCAPNWVVIQKDLQARLGWGRDKMRNTIKECIERGYVRVRKARRMDTTDPKKYKKGSFTHNEFEFSIEGDFTPSQDDLQQDECPHNDYRPRTCFQSPDNQASENKSLPMPNIPMPRTEFYKGNASREDNPAQPTNKTLGGFLQGFGKALPSSVEDEALESQQAPSFTVIPSKSRKHPRKKEHQDVFDWLLSIGLTDENNCVSEDEISYLSHSYPLTKLQDAYCHLLYKQAHQDFKPKSVIAIFKYLLKNEGNLKGRNIEMNVGFANIFKKENNWHTLEIKADYVQDKNYPSKDISMNMNPEDFAYSLQNMFTGMSRGKQSYDY